MGNKMCRRQENVLWMLLIWLNKQRLEIQRKIYNAQYFETWEKGY